MTSPRPTMGRRARNRLVAVVVALAGVGIGAGAGFLLVEHVIPGNSNASARAGPAPGSGSEVAPERVLMRGHQGDDVTRAQRLLLAKGYTEVGRIDGIFGEDTEAAVRRLQQDHRLKVDGIIGPQTWGVLKA